MGKNLALAEMRLILARIVWRFDWELADDDFALEKQKVFIMREKPNLNLYLRRRKDLAE